MSKTVRVEEVTFPFAWQRARKIFVNAAQPVGDVSLTQAEFLDECDINHQIALYTRNRQPLPVWDESIDPDQVQDLSATYIDAWQAIQTVDEAFADLPAAARTRFDNDPLKFAEFLSDGANRDEAIALGLINAPQAAPIPPAEQPSGAADAVPPSPPKEGV